ncbi:MAG: hypothetical protein IPJ32_20980 [Sphingobacteriaceae bacterium]|nr:hypothetical protein [Sphingobacteriaceae bacterium]
MSHDSHNNGHQENKPVAFTTPLILGAVTVFIILCFVSLGNPSHGHGKCECKEECSKECMEACEKGEKEHGGHEEAHADVKHEEAHVAATDSTATPADTTHHAAEPAKEEAHH